MHVVSTCLRGRMFALPSRATTTSSSSGSGGTAAIHARPTAPALAPARGRVCASEYDARRVRHAHGARDRFGGTRWASGGSVEAASNLGPCLSVSCRRSLFIHHIPSLGAVGCGAAARGARRRDCAKSYSYTISTTPCTYLYRHASIIYTSSYRTYCMVLSSILYR